MARTATATKQQQAPTADLLNPQPNQPPATVPPQQAQAKAAAPKLSDELIELRPELEKVLPAHVSVDKFLRVVMTAISQNPDLYRADRRSLFTSCVKCATDGLVPDGREAALVIFNSKDRSLDANGKRVERWIKKVQYMPMVFGILKKVRNSGELQSITANVVLERDQFRYWVDDTGEHVTHEPNVLEAERGKLIAVYAIAKTKDGGVYVEVMTRGQIEQVRAVSRAKDDGPWKDWYDEMARKSVIRRLSKRLPMSTDLETVIRRDDETYDLGARRAIAASGTAAAKALLGLTPSEPEEPEDDEDDEDDEPIFDDDRALALLKDAPDLDTLKATWTEIVDDYVATDRDLPVAVEAMFKDRKEAFEQEK
jgi:recombination protein RecT